MATNWILQIRSGGWVVWGYGPQRPYNVEHVYPDQIRVCIEKLNDIILPFRLPKSETHDTQEYRRCRGLGWRILSEDRRVDTEWALADTMLDLFEDALAWWNRNPDPYDRGELNRVICCCNDASGLW